MTEPLDLSSTALLLMDYQRAIVVRLADPDALLGRVTRVVDLARGKAVPIGHVRVAFEPEDLLKIPATNPMFKRNAAGLPADAPHAQFDDRVAPRPGDMVVRKTRVGAFSTTNLHEQLQARKVTTLVLAGVSTSGVVLSTVRDAADRDYRLIVLADGCADPDEEVHALLMKKVFPRQAEVITVDELTRMLS